MNWLNPNKKKISTNSALFCFNPAFWRRHANKHSQENIIVYHSQKEYESYTTTNAYLSTKKGCVCVCTWESNVKTRKLRLESGSQGHCTRNKVTHTHIFSGPITKWSMPVPIPQIHKRRSTAWHIQHKQYSIYYKRAVSWLDSQAWGLRPA